MFQLRSSWAWKLSFVRNGRIEKPTSCMFSIHLSIPIPPASTESNQDAVSRARPKGMESRGGLDPSEMFFCYLLECADGSYSVGVTDDPEQRRQEHNAGKGAGWTAVRRPVRFVWTEEHSALSSARTRENQLKRWSHAKKAALAGGSPRLRSGQASAKCA